MQTALLNVTGMKCGGCTSTITRALKAVTGVADATVSLATGEATVDYDEQLTTPGQLKAVVESAGYGVSMNGAAAPKSKTCCCSGKNAAAPA
jgi:copper chaperone